MNISVVIPTYNRCDLLKEALSRLMNQNFPSNEFEVIVVDDGSKDGTRDVVSSLQGNTPFSLRYIFQENQGQGVARNKGIKEASGEIVMFLQDDIFVGKDFLSQHMSVHREFPEETVGVLGFIEWDPRLERTDFMNWLTNGSSVLGKFGGHQFAFEKLEGKKWSDFNFFYTSNLSLKRSLLLKQSFDESFSGYGWEDIELGYRLTKEVGFKLRYCEQAIGFHYHPMKEADLERRMQAIGRAAHVIDAKYPELKKVPGIKKRIVFSVLGNWVVLSLCKLFSGVSSVAKTMYFYGLSKQAFMKGIREGEKKGRD